MLSTEFNQTPTLTRFQLIASPTLIYRFNTFLYPNYTCCICVAPCPCTCTQGTGFSYPLVPSFFVDAKMDENLGVPVEGAYIFVDEAQCLEGNKTLRAELRGGKAYCLAFSPVLSTDVGGYSIRRCPFKHTKEYYFRPYSVTEVDEFGEKATSKKECIEKAKEIGVLIPRMFDQCDTPSHIAKWIKTEISHLLDKVKQRMSSESHKDKLRDVLLKAAMGDTLTKMDELFAIHTEFFYVDESDGVHLIFPRRFMIPHLYESVPSVYSLMQSYDTGMAFEFLVHSKLLIDNNEIRCMALRRHTCIELSQGSWFACTRRTTKIQHSTTWIFHLFQQVIQFSKITVNIVNFHLHVCCGWSNTEYQWITRFAFILF